MPYFERPLTILCDVCGEAIEITPDDAYAPCPYCRWNGCEYVEPSYKSPPELN